MKNNNTKAVREGAMMSALTVILILLTWYVPFFSLIGMFACGIPMACLAARNGVKVVVTAFFATAVIAFLVTGSFLSVISIMLMSVLPGAAAGYFLGNGKGFFVSLFAVCLAVCLGWVFELFVIDMLIQGEGIEKMMNEMAAQIENAANMLIKNLPQSGSGEMNPGTAVQSVVDVMKYTLRLYFPSLVVVSSMLIGYIILMLSGFVMKRLRMENISILPFSMLKAPKSMTLVAVAAYIVFLFAKSETMLWSVLANIVFVLYTIIGVCGLSLADYKIRQKIEKTGMRVLIYVVLFIFGGALLPLLINALIIVGIFDSTRDFRKIDAENQCI